ncbi:MAG: hypothetical protein IKS89_05725 [Spirochaetales bacterium]|nr:hypothetical protein [Spirochaetales bacterium]
MKKNIIVVYAVSALAIFLTLTTLFTVRMYGLQKANSQRGDDMFGQISKVIRNGYLAGDRFFPAFSKNVKALFNYDRRLQSLVIKNKENAVLYYYSANPDAVHFYPDKNEAKYTTSRNFMLYKGPVKVTATPPVLNIEILYKISDRAQAVYIFKSLMVYTLVFIIITAVALVVSSRKKTVSAVETVDEDEYVPPVAESVAETKEATYYEPVPEPLEEPEPLIADEENAPRYEHKPTDFGFADIKFFDIALTDCLTESISIKKDLVLAEFKFTAVPGSDLWKLAGEVANECFTLNDLRFAVSDDKFAVIFPDRDLHEGLALCQNFAKSFSVMSGRNILYAGLSSRNGREMDAERLMTETKAALFKCTDEENIVALETDPDKYRDFICSKI